MAGETSNPRTRKHRQHTSRAEQSRARVQPSVQSTCILYLILRYIACSIYCGLWAVLPTCTIPRATVDCTVSSSTVEWRLGGRGPRWWGCAGVCYLPFITPLYPACVFHVQFHVSTSTPLPPPPSPTPVHPAEARVDRVFRSSVFSLIAEPCFPSFTSSCTCTGTSSLHHLRRLHLASQRWLVCSLPSASPLPCAWHFLALPGTSRDYSTGNPQSLQLVRPCTCLLRACRPSSALHESKVSSLITPLRLLFMFS